MRLCIRLTTQASVNIHKNPSSRYHPMRKQKPQGRLQGINKRDANFSHFAYAIISANMREDILSSDLEN